MQALELSENAPKSLENQASTAAPAEARPEPLPRSFERFTLLSRVARGGMGEVYLAAARSIEGAERPLIVKIIRPDHADDRSFVARFLDEARIQAQLQHPGVAQIIEATTDQTGKPYVVVEYVEGRNLSDVRARAGQLGVRVSWPEALALGVCMGEALAHIHERTDPEGRPLEIVHRDLSPQNVMVGFGGDLKLIDFGTARGQNRRCQTIAGVVFAKPGYVAPEVANNSPGGIPADLYAFGVILWELLAGRRFLTGEATAHMVAVGSGKRTLPPLAPIVGAPPEIDQILAQLTATKIEDRYASARVATQDLVKLLQRAPSLADGDRSVRGRISDLMRRLYPAEPTRSRADFARRVAEARSVAPRVVAPPPSPEPPESTDSSVLDGTRYRLGRLIGRGGMGAVHEAVHLDLGRTVALKLLESDTMGEKAQSRFRAEARAIAQLSHDNIVRVYDFGACRDGRLFYAMELLDGETLAMRLLSVPHLPFASVVDFGIQACRALEAAHAASVVHRDLKPANLFVTQTGTLKVLDFGVAKSAAASEAAEKDAITIVGTPEYMAPEQLKGTADARSDLYALGVVLFELATGTLPFEAEGPLEILSRKNSEVAPRVRERGAEPLPPAFDSLLARLLERDPARRPESARALRQELEALLTAPRSRQTLRRKFGSVAVGASLFIGAAVLANAGMRNTQASSALRSSLGEVTARVMSFGEQLKHRREALLAARTASSAVAQSQLAAQPEAKIVAKQPSEPAPVTEASPKEPEIIDADALANEVSAEPVRAPEVSSETAQALAEAKALTDKGRELKALDVLRRAVERHPDDVELLGALSQALSKNRSWGEALRVARHRAELDQSAPARFDLARLERATGHRDRAIELLNGLLGDDQHGSAARELLKSLNGASRVALKD
ncbi:MAG TPA: protein kinase [Polyangiaceae bacterium]|nr:protein kinase [Polyangiaceae bacterium]